MVNTAVPDDQHLPPDFEVAVPGCLQAAVDGLISQLQRSVMLRVKSITSLKCVKLPPQKSSSHFSLGNTMARRVWQFFSPVVSTPPCWPSLQIGGWYVALIRS